MGAPGACRIPGRKGSDEDDGRGSAHRRTPGSDAGRQRHRRRLPGAEGRHVDGRRGLGRPPHRHRPRQAGLPLRTRRRPRLPPCRQALAGPQSPAAAPRARPLPLRPYQRLHSRTRMGAPASPQHRPRAAAPPRRAALRGPQGPRRRPAAPVPPGPDQSARALAALPPRPDPGHGRSREGPPRRATGAVRDGLLEAAARRPLLAQARSLVAAFRPGLRAAHQPTQARPHPRARLPDDRGRRPRRGPRPRQGPEGPGGLRRPRVHAGRQAAEPEVAGRADRARARVRAVRRCGRHGLAAHRRDARRIPRARRATRGRPQLAAAPRRGPRGLDHPGGLPRRAVRLRPWPRDAAHGLLRRGLAAARTAPHGRGARPGAGTPRGLRRQPDHRAVRGVAARAGRTARGRRPGPPPPVRALRRADHVPRHRRCRGPPARDRSGEPRSRLEHQVLRVHARGAPDRHQRREGDVRRGPPPRHRRGLPVRGRGRTGGGRAGRARRPPRLHQDLCRARLPRRVHVGGPGRPLRRDLPPPARHPARRAARRRPRTAGPRRANRPKWSEAGKSTARISENRGSALDRPWKATIHLLSRHGFQCCYARVMPP